MNTTPITFEKTDLEYTLVGSQDKSPQVLEPTGFSILLLNRGGKPFRKDLLAELVKLNCREIISVERDELKPDELCRQGCPIHVLRIKGDYTPGDIINIGIKEAMGKFVFVLWSDMILHSTLISSRVFEKIDERNHFCTVPLFVEDDKVLPTCLAPVMTGLQKLDIVNHLPDENQSRTLFPSDYCGIYQREKFISLGGFDGKIKGAYWQLMDLGFRAALWGETICFQNALKLSYLGDMPVMDITAGHDYSHFFLKTQAILVKNGSGRLPGYRLFSLLLKSRGNAAVVIEEFNQIRSWVRQNKKRFKQDVMTLLGSWTKT